MQQNKGTPAVKLRDDKEDILLSFRGVTAGSSTNYIPIVLCAGFGTRLKPITDYIPKVICPVIDKPLAFFSIEKFFQSGFEKVYCNTHYLSELVELELRACAKHFGYDPERLVFFHEKEILGSGGGVLNIVQNLCAQNVENKNKDVIVVSGDVVADFSLNGMIDIWEARQKNAQALMLSLALHEDREDVLCVSQDGRTVVGFGKSFLESVKCPDSANVDKCTYQQNLNPVARLFSNHQIIAAEIFHGCALRSESIVPMIYKKILAQKEKTILHHDYPESLYWFNVGDMQEYEKCVKYFCTQRNLQFPPTNKMYACHKNLKSISDLVNQLQDSIFLQFQMPD